MRWETCWRQLINLFRFLFVKQFIKLYVDLEKVDRALSNWVDHQMATKASNASAAFNAYFMQQQQQQHKPEPHQTGEPVVSDLHLKMSKKIAQVTKVNFRIFEFYAFECIQMICRMKVVYALNSKNDESENLIATLRLQFDDEREQLFLETNKKMDEFKTQTEKRSDQSSRISELEAKLESFQIQK